MNEAPKQCPNCGKESTLEFARCSYCGSFLISDTKHDSARVSLNKDDFSNNSFNTGNYNQTNLNPPNINSYYNQTGERKSWLVTLLLCIFLGGLGIHRFYTGHMIIGLLQLFTFGGCGIWPIVDLILILTGSYTDSNGRPLDKNS